MSITETIGNGTDRETTELLETLAERRQFFRHTVQNLSHEQVTARHTVSALTLAGLVKHVSAMEEQWVGFIVEGPSRMALPENWQDDPGFWENGWKLLEGETLESALAHYEKVAAHTEEVVRGLPDLDLSHPLPEAPWFAPGASWSARRVLLHLIAETAQHAGHADIIRETIDGQRTMG
ncbi:DinB family protein [Kineosporia sp. NBRC 101731]|uniref:DinB family protein n=1 Tax=Kineosporia sp. NBRC 101731 TaxID=3032199 RepID=UPI0024A36D68|nr:DinB family protein [Kineosporia sp. NBRC 101731]GLY27170.1 hypothetical protein Kisp02_05350 [Kineosporia sp. NBRC 101731]